VRLVNALRLYGVRLRARRPQECFAVIGLAAGVALLFASQVSSTSLQSSVAHLSHGIAGNATLQLRARSAEGFPEGLLRRVRRIPGVRVAAPLLEASASATGPRGSTSAELIGADSSLSELGGTLVGNATPRPFGGFGAVVLSGSLSHAIGVERFGQEVVFKISERSVEAPLYLQPHERQSPALRASPVAIAPLRFAQELANMPGRVSRILVQPTTGGQAGVQAALRTLVRGRLDVRSIDYDEHLFTTAASASNQSTALFSLISALVGFLFAFNAMLFTVPERRRLVVELRSAGYSSLTALGVLLLDAAALGITGSMLGLALGDELSIHVLHSNPAFLSLAFTLGSQRVLSWQSVMIATGGGLLAALVAVLSPLRHVLSRDPLVLIGPSRPSRVALGVKGSSWSASVGGRRSALAGLACLGAATLIVIASPDAAIPAMILSVSALLLLLPFALATTLALVQHTAGMRIGPIPHLAAMELRSAHTRAVAVAATGALAVFGSVAIQGAHRDLLAGLDGATRAMNGYADVWVSPAGSYNLLNTTPFPAVDRNTLARLPGVRSVLLYRGGLLDYGLRRALVIAPSRAAAPLPLQDQVVQGDTGLVDARIRAGGWLVLSRTIASEHGLSVGQRFMLPSPIPMSFRVAALSTNLGWAPGVIVMNADDYARAWGSKAASAYDILLDPDISAAKAVPEIQRALGGDTRKSGLLAQSAGTHIARQSALSHRALARLSQIATLILLVSVLAMVAAIGAMIWQRRPHLAKLKLEGLSRAQLWHTMVFESLMLLGVGYGIGAVFGLYGQLLADRALAQTIDFPVAYSFAAPTALASLGIVLATAVAILAIPGYLAASVPASLAATE
jgi:putative ABC transport system permease protein